MTNECGAILTDASPEAHDEHGCILPDGHDGPHEFVTKSGKHWNWEIDLTCTCEHCMRCEGDYCTEYWLKSKK